MDVVEKVQLAYLANNTGIVTYVLDSEQMREMFWRFAERGIPLIGDWR